MSNAAEAVKVGNENNNSFQWDANQNKAKETSCTCRRYSTGNSCALKHRFGVRIHSDFSDEREIPRTKYEKVTFCEEPVNIPASPGRPRQASPTTVSEIIIIDRIPAGHWPVKRSSSLESRDNPFVPGSELCKEVDDILKRATIIRDRFYINDETIKGELSASDSGIQNDKSVENDSTVVEEQIVSQSVGSENAEPVSKTRQNGKIDENSKPEQVCDQSNGKDVSGDGLEDKKKQKKCCSVM